MPGVARLGDMTTGVGCFPPSAIISVPISTVLIGGVPAAAIGAECAPTHCGHVTHAGPLRLVVTGSSTVFFQGIPAARIGDLIADGDMIAEGSGNVIAGG